MPETTVLGVAEWLLTYAVHSTVLLVAVLLMSKMTRDERALERLWRLGLLGALVTASIPAFGSGVLQRFGATVGLARQLTLAEALELHATTGVMGRIGMPLIWAVLAIWAAVAVAGVGRLLAAHVRLLRILRKQIPFPLRPDLLVLTDTRQDSVLLLRGIQTPIATISGKLCLPEAAVHGLREEELAAVIVHEQAHLARCDPAWLLVTSIVCRVFFFQPLNWMAARRLRSAAEFLCDAAAVERTSRVAVASALGVVSGWTTNPGLMTLGMASSPSLTLRRVHRILQAPRVGARKRELGLPLSGALLLAMVVLGPNIEIHTNGLHARYTISAYDNGGPFSVTVERGRVIAVAFDGVPVPAESIQQKGKVVRVHSALGQAPLQLNLTENGGMQWTSRPKPVASH